MALTNDSAKPSSSAERAAEERALKCEISVGERKRIAMFLWDIAKFFDSLDLGTLTNEVMATNFPIEAYTLTVTAHHAPRRLRLGEAIGDVVVHWAGAS